MEFQYAAITRVRQLNQIKWKASGPGAMPPATKSLLQLLNKLGKGGWELVSVADIGSDNRHELLLKRAVG